MSESWPELIRQTLSGAPEGKQAARKLLGALYPVVQARVARVLWRTRRAADRNVQQEVEDMTQDVFRALFDGGGRALQAWDPARGLSLPNFVGLLAERHAVAVLRSDRRNPWTEVPTVDSAFDRYEADGANPEPQVRSRELLGALLDKLRVALSPLGLHMFQLLYMEERTVDETAAATSMSTDAVYAWRSRLRKTVAALAAELSTPPPVVAGAALEASDER
jgi:DNA-directed RNA polymerase specialized sigma24 family protein